MTKMSPEDALKLQNYLFDCAIKIVQAKRTDYSGTEDPFRNLRMSAFYGVEPWRGVGVRIMDKFSRVRSVMENNGEMSVRESLVDTLADILNYTCIMAGLVWEELGLEIPD